MAGAREYAYESVSGQRLSFEAARLAFDDPFCRIRRPELHRSGDEAARWQKLNIDAPPVALRLWQHTRADGELAPTRTASRRRRLGSYRAKPSVAPEKNRRAQATWLMYDHDRFCAIAKLVSPHVLQTQPIRRTVEMSPELCNRIDCVAGERLRTIMSSCRRSPSTAAIGISCPERGGI